MLVRSRIDGVYSASEWSCTQAMARVMGVLKFAMRSLVGGNGDNAVPRAPP
jgi:hypothetical protein